MDDGELRSIPTMDPLHDMVPSAMGGANRRRGLRSILVMDLLLDVGPLGMSKGGARLRIACSLPQLLS